MSDEKPPAPPDRRALLLAAKGLPTDAHPYLTIEVYVVGEGDPVTVLLEHDLPGEPRGVKPLQLAALTAASGVIESVQESVAQELLTRLLVADRERRAFIAKARREAEEELAGATPYPPAAGSSGEPN